VMANMTRNSADLPDDGANQFDRFAPIHLAGPASKAPNRLRLKANFVSGFKLIEGFQFWPKNISFRKSEIVVISRPSRPTRGAARDRHETWGGMRWTWRCR
jgi:hypothetical protein